MNRGQLAFLVLVNAMVSLVIALAVILVFEARRPDPEELAAISTPRPDLSLAVPAAQPTPTTDAAAATPATIVTDSVPAEPTATPEPPAENIYVVQPGDTMLLIATQNGVTIDDILRANNLTNPDFLFEGQRLVIPVQGGAAPAQNDSPTATTEAPVVTDGVRISSITSPGDLPNEQVLVVNEGSTALSLQGWQLQRSDGPAYTFRSDVPLFTGGSVRVHSAGGADTTIDLYWGLTEPAWQSGVEARLLSPQGDVVHTYTVP